MDGTSIPWGGLGQICNYFAQIALRGLILQTGLILLTLGN